MDTLPLEILRCVCDNFQNKKHTLRAVRLVSQKLASAAAPLLFQTLLLYQTPKSWEKLSSIAACHWLAQYVIKLEIAVLNYLPHFYDFADWRYLTWNGLMTRLTGHRGAQACMCVEGHSIEGYSDYQAHLRYDFAREDYETWKQRNSQRDQGNRERLQIPLSELESAVGLDRYYKDYRYWHDGEIEVWDMMVRSKGPYPPLDLIPFPNLQNLAVLGSQELWSHSESNCNHRNRKVRETAVGPQTCYREQVKHMQPNVLLSLALQMFDASGVNITRLELHRYREVVPDFSLPNPTLKHLRELILEFSDPEFLDVTWPKKTRWELVPWLQVADNLRTLDLAQGPDRYHAFHYYDVVALLHKTSWPKLRSLHFKKTFVRAKSLLQFLQEHGQSLELVRIEQPVIRETAWKSLASELLALDFSSHDCVLDLSDSYDFAGGERNGRNRLDEIENDNFWYDPTNPDLKRNYYYLTHL